MKQKLLINVSVSLSQQQLKELAGEKGQIATTLFSLKMQVRLSFNTFCLPKHTRNCLRDSEQEIAQRYFSRSQLITFDKFLLLYPEEELDVLVLQ